MTRDILLFGAIRPISLDAINGNGDMVKTLNEKYADRTNIRIKFDVLPTDELGSVLLVFLYGEDWENDNVKQGYVSSLQAYAITGDYNDNDDNPLPYPFVGDLKLYKKLLTTSFFGNMWKKNSDALGGDSFVMEDIWYTINGMYVMVKFDV